MAYLTFGDGDFVQIISFGSVPILKFVGANGFVTNVPFNASEKTYKEVLV